MGIEITSGSFGDFVKNNPRSVTAIVILSILAIVFIVYLLIKGGYEAKNTPMGDITKSSGIVAPKLDNSNKAKIKEIADQLNQFIKNKDRQIKYDLQRLMPSNLMVLQRNEFLPPVEKERDVFLENLEVVSPSKTIVIDSVRFNALQEPVLLIVKIN